MFIYRVLPMPATQTNARYYLFNKANGILVHTHTHRQMQWERETGIQTKRSSIYTRIDKQKICVPMLFFFSTFWFFASHPHLTLFVFVLLLLFFKFSLSLPSPLGSVSVSISCSMQTKYTNITPRYVLQPVISICMCVCAYIFIFYRHSV